MIKNKIQNSPISHDILIVLDSYEDIFSDFDARSYSEKTLSVDFLSECRKASLDKEDKINLKLFVPKNKRSPSDEIKIKKRMKEHFFHHLQLEKKEIDRDNLIGFNWFIAGCVLTVLTVILMNTENFGLKILVNIAHPGGWFFFWEGLGKLVLDYKSRHANYKFYKKMSNSLISFYDYKKER
jgi:hypothetical protein